MRYLTYDEYISIGGEIDVTAFNRYIDRACGLIDNVTHSRIQKMAKVPERVKALLRELVDYLNNNCGRDGTIASRSQSAGNVSESVSYTVKNEEQQAIEIDNMICDYLMSVFDDKGTPLLYRGCGV